MLHADRVTLRPRCIVKDCCIVAEGTVIPTDAVIPPFTRVSNDRGNHHGRKRLVTTPLPPAAAVELQERAVEAYQEFVAAQRQSRP